MKKIILFLLFFFILIPIDTFAFVGDYNYEVKSLIRKEDGTITVSGWGILNAGVDDGSGSSPKPIIALGSGTATKDGSAICTGKDGNYYLYTLKAVPLDKNKKYQNNLDKAYLVGKQKGSGTHLTNSLCHRDDKENCPAEFSSCYQNTGWSFEFNESVLNNVNFANGYILYLTIEAGNITEDEKRQVEAQDRKWQVSFPLVIYKDRITGINAEYYNYNTNSVSETMKVKMIVRNGNQQATSSLNGGPCTEKRCQFTNDGVYDVLGVQSTNKGYSAYQLDSHCDCGGWSTSGAFRDRRYIWWKDGACVVNRNGSSCLSTYTWTFSTWVAPPDYMTLILPVDVDQEPLEVKTCNEIVKEQPNENKVINACSGSKQFSGENTTSCTNNNVSVEKFDYYSKSCEETNHNVNLSINGITGNSFNINNGGGISATGKISTNLKCSYTFNTDKFIENYNNVSHNLSLYTRDNPEWYEYSNKKATLDKVLDNYIKMIGNATDWNSNYDFSSLIATLNVKYNSGKTEEKRLQFVTNPKRDTIDLNNDGVKEGNFCVANGRKTINSKTVYTDVVCGESYSGDLSLPKVCISIKTGEVVDCNLSDVINGGNKHYLDLNEKSGNITLKVTNLGYDGNWSVDLKSCAFSSGTPLKEKIKFRQIDLNDPFLQNYNSINHKRGIGTNFKNNTYDFVNIIASDIWASDYLYAFDMSKSDVENIRKNTLKDVNKYLGSDCTLVGNYYRCAFIRDNNYFTKIYNNDN